MLLYIFLVVVLVNTIYFVVFSKFAFSKAENFSGEQDFPVSLIICAKNEAENLKQNIPLWLEQEYPDFEIILINDASVDDTKEIMETFAQGNPNIHTVNIENNETFWSNKKYSLTLGIKRAMHKRMLFTDADCKPASIHWLKLMTAQLSEEKQIVLGYGAYAHKKGILNTLIRFETLMTAIQYYSYSLIGMPYMGVGRNLAYTSHVFYDNRGFMSHMNIPSGDDDLFVNEAATADNVAHCYEPDAFTISEPKESFKEWFHQKRRHITTASNYKSKHQWLLATFYLTSLLFWILAIFCIVLIDWKIPLALIIFRLILQYVFIGAAADMLKEIKIKPWIPLLEFGLIIFQLTIFISNTFSKPGRWK